MAKKGKKLLEYGIKMQNNLKTKTGIFFQSSTCVHAKYLVSISYTKKGNQAYDITMQNDS